MNNTSIYARRFKILNEMTIQEVSDIIKDTTAKDNFKYIYDLSKELYKLGVNIWFSRSYKNFSLYISHLNSYSTAGNLEVRIDPDNNIIVPLVYNPLTECNYLIHFCSNKVWFEFDFRDSKSKELVSILEDNYGYDDYTKDVIFSDVKNIFTYEKERCFKWKYNLEFRWKFKSDY